MQLPRSTFPAASRITPRIFERTQIEANQPEMVVNRIVAAFSMQRRRSSAHSSTSTGETADLPKETHVSSAPKPPPELKPARSSSSRHLVVMVNGLFGSRANWKVIASLLQAHLDVHSTILHISTSNEFTATYEGIDTCGRRLANEIRDVVKKHAELERISILGHSMGGLISRYALGELYDRASNTISGLKPTHFVALATPHIGCGVEPGPAQVPLVAWSAAAGLSGIAGTIAAPFASFAFGRSGAQFFFQDRSVDKPPLLYRLAHDCSKEGLFFKSALMAFETRTCYANRSGDHLVGWANSSLRRVEELPHIPTPKGRGVVREDPLEWAWAQDARASLRRSPAAAELDAARGHFETERDVLDAQTPEELASSASCTPHERDLAAAAITKRGQQSPQEPSTSGAAPEYIDAALRSLQSMPWRRIDVCFLGGVLPMLAHQHLQVQRGWLNFDGRAVAKHLALQMQAMEELVIAAER
jgi:pimeloyl-ACP methyl ester carboxylesterase